MLRLGPSPSYIDRTWNRRYRHQERKSTETSCPFIPLDELLIKSQALSISHLFQGQLFNVLLRKTKHVVFLDTPQADLTWDYWQEMSDGSPSTGSRGRWKVWAAALNSSSNTFGRISRYFNITSAVADDSNISKTTKSNVSPVISHERSRAPLM